MSELKIYMPHIEDGTPVQIKMSLDELVRCRALCAEDGEFPCYELPAKTSSWNKDEIMKACAVCRDRSND